MEYVPYEINVGSTRIKLYQNEFHGLRTFSNIKAGKEFLREEAVGIVKYEESGKNAENCVYTTDKVAEDISAVKDGLFVEELEDGFVLKHKEYAYAWSMSPTIKEIKHYMLASLNRPAATIDSIQSNNNSKDELISELQSTFSQGKCLVLKSTGLLDKLMKPEVQEEVIIPPFEEDFEDFYIPLPPPIMLPPLRKLPPLPTAPKPVRCEAIEEILTRAANQEKENEEVDERIEQIDYELGMIDQEYKFLEEEKKLMEEIEKIKQALEFELDVSLSTDYSSEEEEESTSETSSEEEEESTTSETSSEEEEDSTSETSSEEEEEEKKEDTSSTSEETSESSFWEPSPPETRKYLLRASYSI